MSYKEDMSTAPSAPLVPSKKQRNSAGPSSPTILADEWIARQRKRGKNFRVTAREQAVLMSIVRHFHNQLYIGWPGVPEIGRGAGNGRTGASEGINELLRLPDPPITQTMGTGSQPPIYRFTPGVFQAAGVAVPSALSLPIEEAVRRHPGWRGPAFRAAKGSGDVRKTDDQGSGNAGQTQPGFRTLTLLNNSSELSLLSEDEEDVEENGTNKDTLISSMSGSVPSGTGNSFNDPPIPAAPPVQGVGLSEASEALAMEVLAACGQRVPAAKFQALLRTQTEADIRRVIADHREGGKTKAAQFGLQAYRGVGVNFVDHGEGEPTKGFRYALAQSHAPVAEFRGAFGYVRSAKDLEAEYRKKYSDPDYWTNVTEGKAA